MNFGELNHELVLFILFNIIVVFMLAIDLGLMSKQKDHTMSFKKAFRWTMIWITVSFIFAGFIYIYDTDPMNPNASQDRTLEFIAAYLLEKSLSVDNLFVFIMIFQKFKISNEHQPDVLKWGIIGALILRAIMILSGAALVAKFSWILYFFGAFLIYTAVKIYIHRNEEEEEDFDPDSSRLLKLMRKVVPMTDQFHGRDFFKRIDGKLYATPMLAVLVMIETSDVIFAFDSIPAVFSVSQNPFIVYTSNIFAILGLRALYFMISGIMDLFIYLKSGVAIILAFVGVKMLIPLVGTYVFQKEMHIPIGYSLAVIAGVLFISIILSLPEYRRHHKQGENS
ncbi:MAG: TerC family protein [Leptospiraceae bacterium]|nr:TerC family protein [Leptospiraceae bacterium]